MPVLRCDRCNRKLGEIEPGTKGDANLTCTCGCACYFGSSIPASKRKRTTREQLMMQNPISTPIPPQPVKIKKEKMTFAQIKESWDKAKYEADFEAEHGEKPPF